MKSSGFGHHFDTI